MLVQCWNCHAEIGAGSQRQLDALALRDTLGKSFREIGTELGVTRQRAARLVEGGRGLSPNRAATRESEPEPVRDSPPASERHEWHVESRTGDERNLVVNYTCSCGRGHGEMRHARKEPRNSRG